MDRDVRLPSSVKSYSEVDRLEGRPLRDDLIAVARQHDLGSQNGGWSAEQVALYLYATLHALRQISPERWSQPTKENDV